MAIFLAAPITGARSPMHPSPCAMDPNTITGVNAQGQRIATRLDSVLAVVPDHGHPARTRLLLAEGIVLVDGSYEDWMETLASGWNSSHAEPLGPTAVGLIADRAHRTG